MKRLEAPTLKTASGMPSLTDVAVDSHFNVYVSDYGQQAVYYFPKASANNKPVVVVQNSSNAASLLTTLKGNHVVISGGCGLDSVRPYTRISPRRYQAGTCFSIGTLGLIGGAVDDKLEVMTPVDGGRGLVSVSSPSGSNVFHTPAQEHAQIGGVAFNSNASLAYVSDHHCKCVFAFARPSNGWLAGQPALITRYFGFKDLDIIAVPL